MTNHLTSCLLCCLVNRQWPTSAVSPAVLKHTAANNRRLQMTKTGTHQLCVLLSSELTVAHNGWLWETKTHTHQLSVQLSSASPALPLSQCLLCIHNNTCKKTSLPDTQVHRTDKVTEKKESPVRYHSSYNRYRSRFLATEQASSTLAV